MGQMIGETYFPGNSGQKKKLHMARWYFVAYPIIVLHCVWQTILTYKKVVTMEVAWLPWQMTWPT
jgi:hypothetical protein